MCENNFYFKVIHNVMVIDIFVPYNIQSEFNDSNWCY